MATKKSPARRMDGFENMLTGLGRSSRDKRRGVDTVRDMMLPASAEERWTTEWLLQLLVETPVEDMLRAGFGVHVASIDGPDLEPDEPGAPTDKADAFPANANGPAPVLAPPPKPKPGVIEIDDGPKLEAEKMKAALEDLEALAAFEEALKVERGTGGAVMLLGADDGAKDLTEPLNLDALRSITSLTVYSAREAVPVAWYNDPRASRYGQPAMFRLTVLQMPRAYAGPIEGVIPAPPTLIDVHESRVIVFPGLQTTRLERQRRQGWGQSIIERTFEAAADFRSAGQSMAALLQDFAQAVYKIRGLAEAFQSNDEALFRARLEAIEMSRSVLRGIVLDSEEDFERKPTPVSGLPEVYDRIANTLASAAKIPVTRLLGQAPAGLNATGDADVRAYYDGLAAIRETRLRRRIERLVRILFRASEGPTGGKEPASWSVKFPPLWQQTAEERAAERKTVAETDAIYITAGVLTPEEVAASRFGGDEWSPETTLDLEGRELMAETEAETPPPGSAPAEPPEPEPPEPEDDPKAAE